MPPERASADHSEANAAVVDDGRSFAATLGDCAGTVPEAVAAVDDPTTLGAVVDRVHHLESRCDSLARDLRRLLADGLESSFAGAYLVADDLVTVVNRSDAVASRAESFVTDLAATAPDLSRTECVDLREMADLVAQAATAFGRALAAYLERLATGRSVDVAYSVERVRSLEHECDERRYEFLAEAFDGDVDPGALVRKDLVTTLDGVADAAEDAADELLVVASRDVVD